MRGQLFTQYFLTDGIHTTDEWVSVSAEFTDFRNNIPQLYDSFKNRPNPNEAETEQDLICPILELLGWTDYLPQQGSVRNEQIPDHLLFSDSEGKARAAMLPNTADRYHHAMVVQESKRFGLSLDSPPETRIKATRMTRFWVIWKRRLRSRMGESGGAYFLMGASGGYMTVSSVRGQTVTSSSISKIAY